jgi:uncharacterized protein
MHYHLILTEICNLKCKYCYEKSCKEFNNKLDKKFNFDFSDPEEINIDLEKLKNFLKKDNNPTIIFYGGEPLLKIDKIIKIIDYLKDLNIKYRMQTNGILLDRLPIKYLKNIEKILVSIDGNEKMTNFFRGRGTYNRVIENIKKIREDKYCGEIVARMTISPERLDLFNQIMHLTDLINKKVFDSIHWQIDAGFYSNDFKKDKTTSFFNEYNNLNLKLINWWIEEIKKGKIYKLYPYIGIIKPLLENNKKLGLRCGAGHKGYTITTSGKIVHCPIMNNITDFVAGDLKSDPKKLKKFSCQNECGKCDVYDLCGGRCMYWRCAKLWPKEGDDLICNSIKLYIDKLKENINLIKELINKKAILKSDFDYEEYFGPEIIP